MTYKYPPPEVTIRRYPAFRICDVVVVVRGQEVVLRCPSYSHAVNWAHLECKSYKIPEPATEKGRLPRGIGVERLRDAPAEWSQQFEALGLNPR